MSQISFVKSRDMYPFLIGAVTAVFLIPTLRALTALPKLQQYAEYEWIVIPLLPALFLVGYQVGLKLFGRLAVMREIMRFALIGVSNFAVDTGMLVMLTNYFGAHDPDSALFLTLNVLAVAVAVGNSYFWNRSWTFGTNGTNESHTFIKFIAVTLGAVALNTAAVSIILQLLYTNNFPSHAIPAVKVMATVISMAWNFVGYKYLVFKKYTRP